MSGSTHDFDHILADLGSVLRSVDEREVAALQQAILDAPSTHAAGEGRSGLVARAFAARLAHLGRNVHVIGDATSPPLGRDDLLLICSASGTCGSMKLLAEHAIQAGARVALVTAGVISFLFCQESADVNGDGDTTSIDAAIILQFTAGLIPSLPP